MNINKKILVWSLPAIMLMVVGCKSTNEPVSITTWNVKMCSVALPDDSSQEIEVKGEVNYGMRLDFVKETLTVSASDLEINGKKLNFTSEPIPMGYYRSENLWTAYFKDGHSAGVSENAENISGFLTNGIYYYRPENEQLPGSVADPQAIMSFSVPGYTVKTFSSNAYFSGVTTTTYSFGGMNKSFDNPDAVYRVNFAKDMKSADVVIYNVKFAQEMVNPLVAVYIKGLEVEFNTSGYTLKGEDIIPEMLENGVLVPYEEKKFDSIEINTVEGDMSKIRCSYTCASIFKGNFTGYSVVRVIAE